MKFLRFIVIVVAGAFGGALLGAALLGTAVFVANYGDQSATFFGPAREVWKLMTLVGAVLGLGPGIVIGLVVGATGCSKFTGCFAGSAVGLIPTLLCFWNFLSDTPATLTPTEGTLFLVIAFGPILLGALLGVVLASVNSRWRAWQLVRANRIQFDDVLYLAGVMPAPRGAKYFFRDLASTKFLQEREVIPVLTEHKRHV